MIPNSDIWGLSSTWETSIMSDIGLYNSYIEGKFAPFNLSESTDSSNRYKISAGVAAGKLIPGQEFDTSCCPWRIKGDSYFLSLKKLWFENAYTAHTDDLYADVVKNQGVPIFLSTLPTNASYPKKTEIDGMWLPDPTMPGVTPAYGTAPLLQFNYQKIFLHAKICCSAYNDTEPSDCRTYAVDDYFDNRQSSYPYVRGLAFDVYIWNGTTWRTIDYSLFTICPVNDYVKGFDCGTITIVNDDFITIRDGIRGKGIGAQTDYNAGIIFNDAHIAANAASSYYNQMSSSQKSVSYVAMPDDWDLNVFTRWGIHYAAPYKQGVIKDWVLYQFATLGMWFYTGNAPLTVDMSAPDSSTYIPLFDSWGTTTGEYKSGTDALTAPAAQWRNDVFERDIYHGEPPYDPSTYDDNTTVLPDLSTAYIPTTAKLYPMQAGTVISLISYLNNVSANLNSDYDSATKFLTNNPIDVICALMYYPFDITDIYTGELPAVDDIVLGNVQTNIQATHLNKALVEYDAGSCVYYPPNGINDFRSYKPYSSAELYVPYCGSVSIDPTDFIGHTIKVKYLIDLQTGSCIALIYRDNMVLTTINGQIGVSVPLTGVQTATLQAAQQRVDSAQKAAQMQAISGAVTGVATAAAVIAAVPSGGTSLAALAALGAGGTMITAGLSGLDKQQDMQYQLEHQQTPYKTVGAASAVTSMGNEQACRLIIKRPIMLDSFEPAIYAHNSGYACCITALLSSFTGYVKVSNADVDNIPCTAAERSAILQALQAGVYL